MTTWWKRLDERREELGWSGKELARRSGVTYAVMNKYLNGRIEQPRGKALEKLAKAVGRSALWLREGIEDGSSAHPIVDPTAVAAVAGRVEAGAFREYDDMDQSEPVYINVPRDERFPNARQLAFDVTGDSMNDLKPRPIMDGDRVVGVAYEDVAGQAVLRDGMVVVVERSRDGGHFREWSIKQLVILQDRTEFHPRSTNSRHKPIVVDRDMQADDGTVVQIICLVRRIINDLPL